jgi:hypothetical protein
MAKISSELLDNVKHWRDRADRGAGARRTTGRSGGQAYDDGRGE